MANSQQQCSIGILQESECHLSMYTTLRGFELLEDLPSDVRKILMWRSGLSIINNEATTCFHHKHVYLRRYALKQTRCCDPFDIHNKTKRGGSLREISLETAISLCSRKGFVVPGQKLCPQCRNRLANEAEQSEESEIEMLSDKENDIEQTIYEESTKSVLNSTLCELGVSPLKVHSIPAAYKPSLGKRKLHQIEEAVTKKLATVLDVTESDLDEPDIVKVAKEKQIKADDLDYLVDCMKEKLKVSDRRQQLQILTLIPRSWSIRKAAKEFSVSKNKIQVDIKSIVFYSLICCES